MPALPAARRLARARRPREGRAVPGRDVLGPAGARVRRPGRADPHRRAGAGGARRQPDRSGLHRRRLRATSCGRRSIAPGWRTGRSSRRADDGLTLTDVYIAAAVRCAPPANKPTILERDTCAPFLAREIGLLDVACGSSSRSGRSAGTRRCGRWRRSGTGRRRPQAAVRPWGRGARSGRTRSSARTTRRQQNTFTGRLTPAMFDAVDRARQDARPAGVLTAESAGRRPGPPLVDFAIDGHHGTRSLRGARRRARRQRRRDQARLPQARPAVAPGRQQGARGPGAVQGDQRGLPGPVRPRAPPALRHVRAGRRGRRRRRPGAGFEGFGGFSDIFDAFFGGAAGGGSARRGRPQPGADLRYDLRITFEEAIRGTEKEIEFRVLGRCETCTGSGAKPGTEAVDLPAVRRPRRGPQRPPDDARPDGQRQRLPALPGRGQDRRDAVRDVPGRRPDRAQADASA